MYMRRRGLSSSLPKHLSFVVGGALLTVQAVASLPKRLVREKERNATLLAEGVRAHRHHCDDCDHLEVVSIISGLK